MRARAASTWPKLRRATWREKFIGSMATAIPGHATTYTILKAGSGKVVGKGSNVKVHATGVVKETGKKFWCSHAPCPPSEHDGLV